MSEFSCTSCDLSKSRGKCYVRGVGNLRASVMFIGDAPSNRDSATGVPFSGGDKAVLDNVLSQVGWTRKDVFTTNLVYCKGPEGERGMLAKPTQAQQEACWNNIQREIAFIRPKVIVLLGSNALNFCLGVKTLGAAANKIYDSAEFRGVESFLSGEVKTSTKKGTKVETKLNKADQFKVIATYGPGAIGRDPSLLSTISRAVKLAKDVSEGNGPKPQVYDYKYAYTEEEAYALLCQVRDECGKMGVDDAVSFDIETSGFNWYKLKYRDWVAKTLSIAFCFRPNEAYGISMRPAARSFRTLSLLKQILEGPQQKCGHNGLFDDVFLRGELGIRVKNFNWDTMVMYYHLDQSAALGLDKLSPIYRPDLGFYWEYIEKKYLDKDVTGYEKAPDNLLLEYNCRDVDVTQTLYRELRPRLNDWGAIETYQQISMPHERVLEEMAFDGFPLDVERTIELGKSYAAKARTQEEETLACVGRHPHWWKAKDLEKRGLTIETFRPFNLNSPKQLGPLLYNELKLKVTVYSEKTKEPSTNEEALLAIKNDHPFVMKLMEYRSTKKLLGTYLGWELREDGTEGPNPNGKSLLAAVGEDNRIRAKFSLTGTETGRLSSSFPNLQNQPKTKEFRDLFKAEDGYVFVDADFGALELRMAALLSQEPALLQIFKDGVDPHTATASRMFNIPFDEVKKDGKERKAAKAINFGILYGQGADALADGLAVSKLEAEVWLAAWHKAYPVLSKWINGNSAFVRKNGYIAYSLNRRRPLPSGLSSDPARVADAERQSTNTVCQGTGSDCTATAAARAMKAFDEKLEGKPRIVCEVHDQIIVHCPKDLAEEAMKLLVEAMTTQMPFLPDSIPLTADADIKERWGDGL